jgi:phosphoribosyl 1,2-cyclic phosphodiesterase
MFVFIVQMQWYNLKMSLSVHAIASGSSGNATLVAYKATGYATYLLIDAGLSAAALKKGMQQFDVSPDMLQGIVLTHEHHDHVCGAYTLARKFGVPLIANFATLSAVIGDRRECAHEALATGAKMGFGAISVETFAVPHDAVEPVGISILSPDHKVSVITDAGCVTPAMRDGIYNSDLLIIEANHDVYRLKAGSYPPALKQRILSDKGHLSNETSVDLITDHVVKKGPCVIWLAHLSKENNLPKLALNYARETVKVRTGIPVTIGVALRDKPSLSWTQGATAVQLPLFQ